MHECCLGGKNKPACRLASEAGVPSALDAGLILKRAVCACCAQPAIVASRFSGLLSSYMVAHHLSQSINVDNIVRMSPNGKHAPWMQKICRKRMLEQHCNGMSRMQATQKKTTCQHCTPCRSARRLPTSSMCSSAEHDQGESVAQ